MNNPPPAYRATAETLSGLTPIDVIGPRSSGSTRSARSVTGLFPLVTGNVTGPTLTIPNVFKGCNAVTGLTPQRSPTLALDQALAPSPPGSAAAYPS